MVEVLAPAARCDWCRTRVWNDLQDFVRLVTGQIDAIIAQVRSSVMPFITSE